MTAPRSAALEIGTETQWGRVVAVGITGGERYYWIVKSNCVAMVPADVVESASETIVQKFKCGCRMTEHNAVPCDEHSGEDDPDD